MDHGGPAFPSAHATAHRQEAGVGGYLVSACDPASKNRSRSISEQRLQFIEIHRLDQMRIKAGRSGALPVALGPIAGNGDDRPLEVSLTQLGGDLESSHLRQS